MHLDTPGKWMQALSFASLALALTLAPAVTSPISRHSRPKRGEKLVPSGNCKTAIGRQIAIR